ncbi:MAG: VWA domain-containing protein [Motiliproteus sp.]
MENITVSIVPQKAGLISNSNNVVNALVRIEAPDMPTTPVERAPLNLALVLDRSGSMNGQPMMEAVRCARYVVDHLQQQDRCAIVIYDNEVEVIVPSQHVSDKKVFHRALERVESRGMTALHDGWLAGAEQTALHPSVDALSRVMLISDGGANAGLTDPQAIAEHCRELASAGVTTSTYGLGQHFNEDLMATMASAGNGNAYYGESAEDLIDPFREEFDLLSNLFATNIELQLEAPAEIQLKVLNGYKKLDNGAYQIPSLAYGGEVWAMIEMQVPRGYFDGLMSVSVKATGQAGVQMAGSATLADLPILAAADYDALQPNALATARKQEVMVADYQRRAREASLKGDWAAVDILIEEATELAEDNEWLGDSLNSLRRYSLNRDGARFSKEAMYSSSKLSSRVADKYEERASYCRTMEDSKPAFLRRKMEQGKRA